MAGHSHFKNMAHRKGIVDAKRAKLWSKLSRYIMIAAKNGGGDPVSNLKLRYAVDKARSVSMPKDNIERAIKKGTGEAAGTVFDEVTYEAYGPGGVAILIETLTDNRSRTNAEVRSILEKGGGKMGAPGSVAYLFDRKGVIAIPMKDIDEDTLMGIVLEAGAENLEKSGDNYEITCDAAAIQQVRAALEANNIMPAAAEIQQIGKTRVDADLETGQRILKLMDTLDDNDDVQNVYSNLNVTDEMMAGV
jgi:YebC/PmpR family DNA-binding regulatory protein